MCVIIHKPENTKLNREKFEQCWRRNAHGLGFHSVKDGLWYTKKGLMDMEEAWKEIEPFTDTSADSVFHFRIQSRGGVSPELTHPFECGNERYLFHNGTVKIFPHLNGDSDTAGLAKLITLLTDEDACSLLKVLSDKAHGRFVFVDSKKNKHIFGDKESVTQDGLWFSNTKHETHKGGALAVGDGADDCEYYGYHGYYISDKWDIKKDRKTEIVRIAGMLGIDVEDLDPSFMEVLLYRLQKIKTPEDFFNFIEFNL